MIAPAAGFTRCLVDGVEQAVLAADDRGLAFGDGLFETMAVIGGRVRFGDRHLARLERGCRRLGLPLPDRGALAQDLATLADGVERGVIKLIVTRGSGGDGYAMPEPAMPRRIALARPWPPTDPARYAQGLRLGICRTRLGACRRLAGLKTLNRLEQVLGREEVRRLGLDEGLMLDETDAVIEATAANLFVVRSGAVITPDLSLSGVAGVMRDVVMEALAASGIACRVGRIELAWLLEADEIWLTNALAGVLSAASLGPRRFGHPALAAELTRGWVEQGITPCG